MRTFLSVLGVAVAVLALTMPQSAEAGGQSHHPIPEKLNNRLAEMIKWFEARIPIYEKANYLLKKLGTEVAKLSDLHNGIDFYYKGASDLQYLSGGTTTPIGVRVVKISDGGPDLKPIEEVVKKALQKRTVKNILQLSPEIKSAFKQIMHVKQ